MTKTKDQDQRPKTKDQTKRPKTKATIRQRYLYHARPGSTARALRDITIDERPQNAGSSCVLNWETRTEVERDRVRVRIRVRLRIRLGSGLGLGLELGTKTMTKIEARMHHLKHKDKKSVSCIVLC